MPIRTLKSDIGLILLLSLLNMLKLRTFILEKLDTVMLLSLIVIRYLTIATVYPSFSTCLQVWLQIFVSYLITTLTNHFSKRTCSQMFNCIIISLHTLMIIVIWHHCRSIWTCKWTHELLLFQLIFSEPVDWV